MDSGLTVKLTGVRQGKSYRPPQVPLHFRSNFGLGQAGRSEGMMNCKQGDLAVIVRSVAGNEGKIVRCVRFIGNEVASMGDGISIYAMWHVEPPINDWRGFAKSVCADAFMRPLRDSDGEDEVLRLVGRTSGTSQAA